MIYSKKLDTTQLLAILCQSKNPIAIYSGEEILIELANRAMLSAWGKNASVIGKTLSQALPEIADQPFVRMLQQVWKTGIDDVGEAIPAELIVDGKLQRYYFDYEYRAIKDEDGVVYAIMHAAIDVTEKVLAKEELERAKLEAKTLLEKQSANEELYAENQALELQVAQKIIEAKQHASLFRRLVDQAPVAITVLQGEQLIVDIVNPRMLEVWGKDISILGKPLAEAMPELEGQPFIGILVNVLKTGVPFYGQESWAQIEREGQMVEGYFNFDCQPLRDADGVITSVLQVVTEVTDQVVARLEIQETKTMMDMAINAAKLGSWQIEPLSKSLVYNEALRMMYGYQAIEPMTFDMAIAQVTDEYRDLLIREIQTAIEHGGQYDITYSQRRFDNNELIWLRAFGKIGPALDSGQTFSGFVMDVTVQKQDEQRKNDFIGMVSHELKTPLTSLNGYVQLLQRNAQQQGNAYSEKIALSAVRQLEKMTAMINGFLNLSRLESGKLVLEMSNFNINGLLVEIIAEQAVTSTAHEIKLNQHQNAAVFADRIKIGSVISNLLSNAIKYSPGADQVLVNCRTVDNQVEICVSDKGIGISSEHIGQLFDRFYRVESMPISGFGIGLYLSAEVINRHGGKIWVESEPGKGATFCFRLPLASTQSK